MRGTISALNVTDKTVVKLLKNDFNLLPVKGLKTKALLTFATTCTCY